MKALAAAIPLRGIVVTTGMISTRSFVGSFGMNYA